MVLVIYFFFVLGLALLLSIGKQELKLSPRQARRVARVVDIDVSSMQYVQRIGYERGIPLSGKGSYADGRNCFTGQEPWNAFETSEAKKLFRVHWYFIHEVDIEGIYFYDRYDDYTQAFNRSLGKNCVSKTCHFDLTRFIAICGEPSIPKPLYLDKHTCLDGSYLESHLYVPAFEQWGYFGAFGDPKNVTWVQLQNKKAQEKYGKNCKSGKCNYLPGIGPAYYICSAPFLIPQHRMQLAAVMLISHLVLSPLGFDPS